MDQIIFTSTTKLELISELKASILEGVEAMLREARKEDLNAKEWLTSKETEELLKVSNVTRWNWTKSGILHGHKIGTRLRYRKDEVLQALMLLEARNGKIKK